MLLYLTWRQWGEKKILEREIQRLVLRDYYWKIENTDSWSQLTSVNLTLGSHEVGLGLKTLDVSGSLEGGVANFDFFLIEETE